MLIFPLNNTFAHLSLQVIVCECVCVFLCLIRCNVHLSFHWLKLITHFSGNPELPFASPGTSFNPFQYVTIHCMVLLSYTLYWSLQFLYDAGVTSVRYFDLRYMFRSHQIKASENCSCLKEPCDFNSCCTLRGIFQFHVFISWRD